MTTKTQRLEMRLSPEQKVLLERAVALNGQVLASFVRSQLMQRAQQIVDEHTRTILSARDFDRFLEVLDGAPEPAPALRAAFRRHQPGRD
ncbi:MAG: DUF1778 domain-containing protein [Candidatus Latescibacterota bacterium]